MSRVPAPLAAAHPYPLVYACKWCGEVIARYPNVSSHEPVTLSVCDRPVCLEAARREWGKR